MPAFFCSGFNGRGVGPDGLRIALAQMDKLECLKSLLIRMAGSHKDKPEPQLGVSDVFSRVDFAREEPLFKDSARLSMWASACALAWAKAVAWPAIWDHAVSVIRPVSS